MIAATLVLAHRPEERANTVLRYRFPVLPRVGEVIAIQFNAASLFAKEYHVRRVTWDLMGTGGPNALGEAGSVTIECDPIDSRSLSAEKAAPGLKASLASV